MLSTVKVVFLCLGVSLSALVHADESYLCVTEFAGGLTFDANSRKWHGGAFVPDIKYLVTTSSGDDGHARRIVKNSGSEAVEYWCDDKFTETGFLFCRNAFGVFRFNQKNLRFLSTYMVGYVTDGIQASDEQASKEGDNTPIIRGGTCRHM